MSDSDDTDILLLIPPYFFYTSTLAGESEFKSNLKALKDSEFSVNGTIKELNYSSNLLEMNNRTEQYVSKGEEALPPSYQFLPPNKQLELNNINARLSAYEYEANPSEDFSSSSKFKKPPPEQEEEHYNCQPNRLSLAHSTPKEKPQLELSEFNVNSVDNNVLHEIDNFLQDQNYISFCNVNNGNNSEHFETISGENENDQVLSLPNTLNAAANVGNKYDKLNEQSQKCQPQHEKLISLDEIWGKNGRKSSLTFKEEQYRRLHLEKTVRKLQSHLLEYQQRLSVAIEVDRSKDCALSSVQVENKRYVLLVFWK